mgnify:CR=1 FL=1
MNTEVTTGSILSTNHNTTSNDILIHYASKLYNEDDPVMRQVYYNTLIRLLNGKTIPRA